MVAPSTITLWLAYFDLDAEERERERSGMMDPKDWATEGYGTLS